MPSVGFCSRCCNCNLKLAETVSHVVPGVTVFQCGELISNIYLRFITQHYGICRYFRYIDYLSLIDTEVEGRKEMFI